MSCKIKINYQTNYVRNDRGKFSELIVSVFFFFSSLECWEYRNKRGFM